MWASVVARTLIEEASVTITATGATGMISRRANVDAADVMVDISATSGSRTAAFPTALNNADPAGNRCDLPCQFTMSVINAADRSGRVSIS